MSKKAKIEVAALAAFAGVLTGLTQTAQPVRADEQSLTQEDSLSLTIAAQCSFATAGEGSASGQNFYGTGLGGAEVEFNNDGIRTFNIACNHVSGYSVHAYATNLVSENGFDPIPFAKYTDYSAAVNGNQAMWTAKVQDNDAADYGTNSSNAKVIKTKSSASALAGDEFSITYKAYVGKATPSGTYTGQAVYILAMNVDDGTPYNGTYTISYDANGGADAPANQSGTGYAALSTDVPTRDEYDFVGWALTADATGATYLPGSVVTLTRANTTFYAVWSYNPTMQSFSKAKCDALAQGEAKVLTDARDGKRYVVSRLADGACWMMQDLDMDLYVDNADVTATTGGTGAMGTKNAAGDFVAFTSENTDINPSENGGSSAWVVSDNNLAYNTLKTKATGLAEHKWDSYGRNGGTSGTYEVRSYDEGTNKCMKTYSVKTADSDTTEDNPNAVTCDNKIGQANTQRIGNYYNWPAATAGTGTYSVNTANTHVSDSICPKGWKLPYGGTSAETAGTSNSALGGFGNLFKSEGIVSVTTSNTTMTDNMMAQVTGAVATASGYRLSFLRSGNYNYSTGKVASRGSYGRYWSSMANNASYAYSLYFAASYLNPGTNYNVKGYGYAVRCVLVE